MGGNLLLCEDSFQVVDWSRFPKLLKVLSDTIGTARKINKDMFYSSEELLYMTVTDEISFYELCYVTSKEDEDKKRELLGINDQSFNDFINLIIELQYLPSLTCDDLISLEKKLPEQNNGLAGVVFKDSLDKNKCVREIDSWYMFHFFYYCSNSYSTYFFENQRLHCENQKLDFNPLFPNVHYTNKCYENRWDLFYGSGNTDAENEEYQRIFGKDEKGYPLYSKMAVFIANRNFYWYDAELSKYNNDNNPVKKGGKKTTPYQIFATGVGKDRKYLSTDFEKGCFEMCDYKGKHEGEYFFNGNYNKGSQDTTGGHDIVLP